MATLTVRAFNQAGYSKDIAPITEKQVHLTDGRITIRDRLHNGIRLRPADFPEVVYFEIVVTKD